jgi:hypothetical protein
MIIDHPHADDAAESSVHLPFVGRVLTRHFPAMRFCLSAIRHPLSASESHCG